MNRKNRKSNKTHRYSVLHEHEFSPMARSTNTKNRKRSNERLACRKNSAGRNREW